jgi:hypothetical protein
MVVLRSPSGKSLEELLIENKLLTEGETARAFCQSNKRKEEY